LGLSGKFPAQNLSRFFQYSMQVNILGLSAVAFFILFSTSFLLILFVKTESQQVSGLGKPKP